ncbi:MAG TPA: DNA replication and repair protein RecF [Solirubrobacteraceae bacterium]|nr:DNA replication and repair protein RecF [Solirubrobacteraceae bacterium]
MRVDSLRLRDFRSYHRAEARLGEGLTVVHGPNGAGKSNLLEALYFGCTGASPRTRNDRELVAFGADATRVEVDVVDGDERHELTVAYGPGPDAGRSVKRMTADGAPLERLLDSPLRPLISAFFPDRLAVVKGAPSVRRAHLDHFVSACWPARSVTVRDYGRILAQRNALLAAIRAGRSSRSSLETWDQELARAAVALMAARREAADELAGRFAAHADELGLGGSASLDYRPRSRAATSAEFLSELHAHESEDMRRGFSSHGPHRDDLALKRDGRELRTFGSQGQQRLALLALLLAERTLLAERRGTPPVMLLDDVMSELDAERRERLVQGLAGAGQSVISTTDLDHVPAAAGHGTTRLLARDGTLVQEAVAA